MSDQERLHDEHAVHYVSEDEGQGADSDKPGWQKELWEWVKSIGTALVIVLILNQFIFNLSTVEGHSMQPTLEDNEWLFINRAVYLFGEPKRGDIVILRDPHRNLGWNQYLVKRVIGVPGDAVEIRGGELYVNDQPLDEPYIDVQIEDGDMPLITLGDGEYFVMGDNRHWRSSLDSREFGPVPETLIKGRAEFVIWPLSRLGGLKNR